MQQKTRYFTITAYWKDTGPKNTFQVVVKGTDEITEDDESIFFYGLTEELIQQAIKDKENTIYDFVILGYEELKEI